MILYYRLKHLLASVVETSCIIIIPLINLVINPQFLLIPVTGKWFSHNAISRNLILYGSNFDSYFNTEIDGNIFNWQYLDLLWCLYPPLWLVLNKPTASPYVGGCFGIYIHIMFMLANRCFELVGCHAFTVLDNNLFRWLSTYTNWWKLMHYLLHTTHIDDGLMAYTID